MNEYIELDRGDYLLYTNYFGLKDKYIKYLSVLYGSQLIVDNSQAFFAEPVNVAGVFYSPRKFIGISDGGIVYCRGNSCIESIAKDISYNRFSHLLKRIDVNPQEGYSDFRMNSQSLSGQPIKIMSDLSRRILTSVNYKNVKSRRRKNYGILNKYLGNTNQLHFGDLTNIACPMVYPYLLDDLTLKQKLIDNSIFVATYWPNVMQWCKQGDWEYELAQKTCFLPIDQRYGEEEMNKIIETICKQ